MGNEYPREDRLTEKIRKRREMAGAVDQPVKVETVAEKPFANLIIEPSSPIEILAPKVAPVSGKPNSDVQEMIAFAVEAIEQNENAMKIAKKLEAIQSTGLKNKGNSRYPLTITKDRLMHWLTIYRKHYFFFPRSFNRALRQLGGILAICFSLLMMVSSLVHAAPLPIPSGIEIMEKSVEAIRFKDSFANATLTLTSREGVARVRKTSGYTKLRTNGTDNMRLVRFLAPADIKGTATLMIENSKGDDDMWVYLPALSKVRRLSASNKSEAFVGTDFSYGDVIGHKTSDWIHKLVQEDVVDGAPCYLIDSLPANDTVKANSGYSKRETCVRKDNFVAVRADIWDVAGQPLKRIQLNNIKQVGSAGHWQPLLWIAENLQTGHKTTIQFDEFKAEINVAEKLFKPQELDK